MSYKYELHCHTSVISKCSKFEPKDIVKLYTTLGFDGVFITDHFITGNTAVSKDLPWEEQIDRFADGYREVKRLAEGTGLKVFFGMEHSYKGTDFLVYGLGVEYYQKHPEILTQSVKELSTMLRGAGGSFFQAHPTREAGYIDHIRLFPRSVDGIESLNTSRTDFENNFANIYANLYELPKICGSDIHRLNLKNIAVFETEEEITDETQVLSIVKSGKYKIYSVENPFYVEEVK